MVVEFQQGDYVMDEKSVLWKVKSTWRNLGNDLIIILQRFGSRERFVASSGLTYQHFRHATDVEILAARLSQ